MKDLDDLFYLFLRIFILIALL